MNGTWRLEPATASSIISAVTAVEIPSRRLTSALTELAEAMTPSDTVRHAAETFGTRHRDVPARLAARISDVADAGAAVVATIGAGDDFMAAEVRLAAAATDAAPTQSGGR